MNTWNSGILDQFNIQHILIKTPYYAVPIGKRGYFCLYNGKTQVKKGKTGYGRLDLWMICFHKIALEKYFK